ncbi:glycoside hydrolase family 81 protein [Mycena maculata]|uniref:glucan endo-1,3-beta-D-glucosidase n=1 Tax=Mycena maculata TaxID=230809 RepID=A0AAD7K562_9AGAR|nr:glycoside hydrolase family 81 protein [Mycena maculata]
MAIGPIDTSLPSLPGGIVVSAAPPGPFFRDFEPPFPTTGWWVGYAAAPSQDSVVAGPFPYMSHALDTGLQFGISNTRNFDGTSIIQTTQMDWEASYVQNPNSHTSHKATTWDTQSITVKYFAASGAGFTTYLVPGSPYMTFNYNVATVLLTSRNGNILSVNGKTVGTSPVSVSGTKFTVTNGAGTYVVYSLGGESITLTANSTSLTGGATFTGIIRIARVTTESTSQAILDQYSTTYPTGVALDYTFTGDNATMSFTWNVVGNAANLLHLSWPHHRKHLVNPAYVTGLSYLTTKGYMKPVVGNLWKLSYALPTITWHTPRSPQASCTKQIIQALEYEIAHLTTATGRSTYAAYETAWGGVVDGPGATDPNIDFGNGYYNDHHFHYGYMLHGAAVIAKYDPSWWNTNKNFVTAFARDIGNPSTADPYFTVARCKDWLAGHSWGSYLVLDFAFIVFNKIRAASGIANGGGSRDQESVGEAVNAYYGLILFADILGNQDIKNWARLLYATEVSGAQTYWHLYPNDNDPDTPYPEAGLRNLTTIGNVMDYQAGAWLFWGAQRSQIAAIQMLPVTPINEDMYDTAWLNGVWNYVSSELDDPAVGDEWKSIIYMAYSEVSPQTAFARSTNITAWGGTTSQAHLLYHLSTRKNPGGGNICTSAPANPTGTFLIRTSTGKLVSSSTAAPQLVADSSVGTPFSFAYMPGGGSIFNTATSQYVTADPNAAVPLAAARAVAQAWENFKVVLQSDGTYVMLAGVNSQYVTIDSTGALFNNGASSATATKFTLVAQWYVQDTCPLADSI